MFLVRPLSEPRLLSHALYVSNTNMADNHSGAFRTRENVLKEVKIIKGIDMLRAAVKQTRLVGSVRDRR